MEDPGRRRSPRIGRSFEQFHGEKPMAVFKEEFVERQQVFMGEFSQRAELYLEAVNADGVDVAECLEGYAGPALTILDLIDDAHPARAKAPDDGEPVVSREFLEHEKLTKSKVKSDGPSRMLMS